MYFCKLFLLSMPNRSQRSEVTGQGKSRGKRGLFLLSCLMVVAGTGSAGAQDPAPSDRLLIRATPASNITRAVRVEQAPVLDGRDDDAVWNSAPMIEDFIQMLPTEAGLPLFPTSVRVVYDERNLFIFVRAHDPHQENHQRMPSPAIRFRHRSPISFCSFTEYSCNTIPAKRL